MAEDGWSNKLLWSPPTQNLWWTWETSVAWVINLLNCDAVTDYLEWREVNGSDHRFIKENRMGKKAGWTRIQKSLVYSHPHHLSDLWIYSLERERLAFLLPEAPTVDVSPRLMMQMSACKVQSAGQSERPVQATYTAGWWRVSWLTNQPLRTGEASFVFDTVVGAIVTAVIIGRHSCLELGWRILSEYSATTHSHDRGRRNFKWRYASP